MKYKDPLSAPLPTSPPGAEWAKKQEEDRYTFLRVTVWAALGQVPIFAAVNFYCGSPLAALTVALAALPMALAYRFGKVFRSPNLGGNLVMASGYVLYAVNSFLTGGISSPVLIWSIAHPILATVICGKKSGLVWTFLVMLQVIGFYAYQKLGGTVMQQYTEQGYWIALYTAMVGLAALTLILGLSSEYYRNRYVKKIEAKNRELRKTLESIRQLKELLPICRQCKNVRSDTGYWHKLEIYFKTHSEVTFTHSICSECLAKVKSQEGLT